MCTSGPDYMEENEYEKELFSQSEKLWKSYQDNYVPLENQVIEQTQAKRSAGYKQHSTDKAVNAARMEQPGTALTSAGMDPSGGGFMQTSNDAQNVSGTAGAYGAMAGHQSAEDQYMSGMMGLSQAGRGQQSEALSGLNSLAANQAGVDAAELAANQTVRNARWGALGTMAGAGGMMYGYQQGWFKPKTDNPFSGNSNANPLG